MLLQQPKNNSVNLVFLAHSSLDLPNYYYNYRALREMFKFIQLIDKEIEIIVLSMKVAYNLIFSRKFLEKQISYFLINNKIYKKHFCIPLLLFFNIKSFFKNHGFNSICMFYLPCSFQVFPLQIKILQIPSIYFLLICNTKFSLL